MWSKLCYFSPLWKEKSECAETPRRLESCAEVNFRQRTSCSTWTFVSVWVHGFHERDCVFVCVVQVCWKGKRKLTRTDRKREGWNNYVSTHRLFDLQEKGVSPKTASGSRALCSASTTHYPVAVVKSNLHGTFRADTDAAKVKKRKISLELPLISLYFTCNEL